MVNVSVYEQTCHGVLQWRVMRDDGLYIFDRIQTDFETREDAVDAIRGEFRRKRLGPVHIHVYLMDRQCGGRNRRCVDLQYSDV